MIVAGGVPAEWKRGLGPEILSFVVCPMDRLSVHVMVFFFTGSTAKRPRNSDEGGKHQWSEAVQQFVNSKSVGCLPNFSFERALLVP